MKSIARRRRFRNSSAPRRFLRPLLEQLESRLLMASDWQNPRNIRDTSDDGIVTAMDVLQVVNELNDPQYHGADSQYFARPAGAELPFLDVTGNGAAEPLDALTVINAINGDFTPPEVSLRLVHDSAPRGTTNSDNVTFSAQFAGSVSDDLTGVAALEFQINGGPFRPVSFNRDGGFTIDGDDENIPTGQPLLTFRTTDARQNAGASSPLHFTFDVEPPTLELDDDSSRLTNGNVRITGRLTDDFAGAESLLAQVDLQDVVAVTIAADGSFAFNSTLPSDGTADGHHVIRFRGTDRAGNLSGLSSVQWQLDTRPPTVASTATGTLREKIATFDLQFGEAMGAAAFSPANYTLSATSGPTAGQSFPLQNIEQLDSRTARLNLPAALQNAQYRLTVGAQVTDTAGNRATPGQLAFTVEQPTAVSELSPANGEELVSLTRETIVRFDNPIDPATITADSFFLIANGERLPGHIRVSPTERFATFFYNTPLPPSTEVRVTIDGNAILRRDGLPVDANRDSEPGGVGTADFRTLPLTFIPGTRIFGYVMDSYNRNPDGSDRPIQGVTISLDANPNVKAVTNAAGLFRTGPARFGRQRHGRRPARTGVLRSHRRQHRHGRSGRHGLCHAGQTVPHGPRPAHAIEHGRDAVQHLPAADGHERHRAAEPHGRHGGRLRPRRSSPDSRHVPQRSRQGPDGD